MRAEGHVEQMNAPKVPHGSAHKTAAQPEPRVLTHPEIKVIVLGLMLTMFLGALDQTIVATALPTIGRYFNSLDDLSWVVTAYLLTSTASTPLYGKLSDIYGRRVVMLTAIAIFIVGSIACAMAPSMPALVLARALQGLGGGGLMALAQTIIADIVSPRERGRYPGLYRRGVRLVLDRRPGAGRSSHRASRLVADLLDQPAARA